MGDNVDLHLVQALLRDSLSRTTTLSEVIVGSVVPRIEGVEARLDGFDGRMRALERRQSAVENALGRLTHEVSGLHADLDYLRHSVPEMMAMIGGLARSIESMQGPEVPTSPAG